MGINSAFKGLNSVKQFFSKPVLYSRTNTSTHIPSNIIWRFAWK